MSGQTLDARPAVHAPATTRTQPTHTLCIDAAIYKSERHHQLGARSAQHQPSTRTRALWLNVWTDTALRMVRAERLFCWRRRFPRDRAPQK